jgi:probable F420-dependent oxidoreductase
VKFWFAVMHVEPSEVLALAPWAEELGYEGILVADHLVFPERIESKYPYSASGVPKWERATAWLDAWVAIGAMAAVTTRLRFSTNVYVAPARHPLIVAKAVSTAATLSGGRVALGAGVGWMREEFVALGQSFERRGRRMDEMIEVLRLLWTGEMVEHHGEFFDLPAMQMSPPPPGPIPIWIGGHSDVAVRRAIRADGWIGSLYSLDEAVRRTEEVMAARRRAGTTGDFEVLVALAGPPDDLDAYRRLEDAGVTGVMCAPHLTMAGPATTRDRLEAFAERVVAVA